MLYDVGKIAERKLHVCFLCQSIRRWFVYRGTLGSIFLLSRVHTTVQNAFVLRKVLRIPTLESTEPVTVFLRPLPPLHLRLLGCKYGIVNCISSSVALSHSGIGRILWRIMENSLRMFRKKSTGVQVGRGDDDDGGAAPAVRMEEVGRGLRTFAKPHQCVLAGVGKGAQHVLLRSTTRPVSLDTADTSSFPSLSGLLSLSVHAPPCPPLARARPQGTRTS